MAIASLPHIFNYIAKTGKGEDRGRKAPDFPQKITFFTFFALSLKFRG
jgi:hypothetical protein